MKYALAFSALLLATPAIAGDSLKTAAMIAVQVDTCCATVEQGVVRDLIVRGSMEENITISDAFNVAMGMQRAYTDVIATVGSREAFCAGGKQARARQ